MVLHDDDEDVVKGRNRGHGCSLCRLRQGSAAVHQSAGRQIILICTHASGEIANGTADQAEVCAPP